MSQRAAARGRRIFKRVSIGSMPFIRCLVDTDRCYLLYLEVRIAGWDVGDRGLRRRHSSLRKGQLDGMRVTAVDHGDHGGAAQQAAPKKGS